jgi:HlyD family secretion protein
MAVNTRKSMRNTMLAGYGAIALLIGVFGGWAAMTDINGAVIANATIVAESYSKRVQHQEGGIVSKILVRDGDRVTEGQPLITLDPTDSRAELAIIQNSLDELTVKKARLESQRDGLTELQLPQIIVAKVGEAPIAAIVNGQLKLLQSTTESVKGKKEQLLQQVAQLNEQIGGIDAQIASKKQQSKLIAEELAGLKKPLAERGA